MWAAFKSDLKEFASSAANETNAVASKVVGNVNILGEGAADADDGDGGRTSPNFASSGGGGNGGGSGGGSGNVGRHDGSLLFANAAYSIGTKGLQGLSSVSSMVGGIVAPRTSISNDNDNSSSNRGGKSYSAASSFSNNPPSSALSSMLAEEENEEEELGWDDEDDELNVEDGDEDTDDANVKMEGGEAAKNADVDGPKDLTEAAAESSNAPSSSVDQEVVRALQSKLESVEKCRADLQSEHRRQTAELVELRAKLVEMEQQHQSNNEGEPKKDEEATDTNEEVVQVLQLEIERLKQLFEEQLEIATEEHKQAIAALIQEKEALENELHSYQQKNQDLVTEIQTLLEMQNQRESHVADQSSNDDQALLQQYQKQIQELTSELAALQENLEDTTAALSQVNEESTLQNQRHQEETAQHLIRTSALEESLTHTKEEHARAIDEVEDSKSKLAEMEKIVQVVKTELETKELEFEDRLQVEIAKAKSSAVNAQSELVLNTSTASSYVTSDDIRHEEEDDDDDDIDDHVNLAAAAIASATLDDNLAKRSQRDEEPIMDTNAEVIDLSTPDTKKDQSAGVIDLVKSDTEEDLSDDWGDGGWGDDD